MSSPIELQTGIVGDDMRPCASSIDSETCTTNDDAKSAGVDEMDRAEPSETKTVIMRGTPTRRVGKVSSRGAHERAVKVAGAPPRRRAASVFGTIGREIVSYPEPMAIRVTIQDVAVEKELPTEQECERSEFWTEENEQIDVQETENDKIEMQQDCENTNDDASAEIFAERRIYVRFKELPDDTGAAYIHVLMGLFTDNPGIDVVALVFDRANEIVEIAAPNGVDYDEVSEAVQNIVGEDAIVEILEIHPRVA